MISIVHTSEIEPNIVRSKQSRAITGMLSRSLKNKCTSHALHHSVSLGPWLINSISGKLFDKINPLKYSSMKNGLAMFIYKELIKHLSRHAMQSSRGNEQTFIVEGGFPSIQMASKCRNFVSKACEELVATGVICSYECNTLENRHAYKFFISTEFSSFIKMHMRNNVHIYDKLRLYT